MRPALVLALMSAGCAAPNAPPPPATAENAPPRNAPAPPPQVWRGSLRCGPGHNRGTRPSSAQIELTVAGSTARYEREAGGGEREQGGGTVAPDGSLTLTGQVSSATFSYRTQYSGVLDPDGSTSRLTGSQKAPGPLRGRAERACSMSLRRDG